MEPAATVWSNNVLGAKGNNEFKSTEVREVNLFRNAMASKSSIYAILVKIHRSFRLTVVPRELLSST